MKSLHICVILASVFLVTACGQRSSASVSGKRENAAEATAKKSPADIIVTEKDITNRPYETLGDIEANVSKWTIFDADPTKEKVEQALREKAAEMGADAVVLVRYGTVGMSVTSWGSLDGHGRAVKFK